MTNCFQLRTLFPRVLLVLSLIVCSVVTLSQVHSEDRSVVLRELDEKARGQIALMTLDGQPQMRIKGFHKPSLLSVMSDGRILVFDPATREISAIVGRGDSFSIDRVWRLSAECFDPVVLYSATPDVAMIVDRKGQVFHFLADGSIQKLPAPVGNSGILSGVALSDGRIVMIRSDAKDFSESLFLVQPGGDSWSPISVVGQVPADVVAPNGVAAVGDAIYLWRGGTSTVVHGELTGTTLTISGALNHPGVALVAPDRRGGASIVTFAGKVARVAAKAGENSEYQFINVPNSAVFDPTRGALLLSHEYPRSERWPERRNAIFSHEFRPFAWNIFWPIVGGALVCTLLWACCALRWGYERAPSTETILRDQEYYKLSWKVLLAAAGLLLIAASGLYLAWGAQQGLLAGLGKEVWRLPYVIGACAVAAAVEFWRRWRPCKDEPLSFVSALRAPAPRLGIAYLFPLCVISACAGVLYFMGIQRQYTSGYREAVFFSGLAFALGVLVVDLWICRKSLWQWIRKEWLFFVPPLVVGGVTFFYRLVDVPYNTHFDFTSTGFVAEQFLRGAKDGAWDWGFVPAPVIGSVSEILGLLIGGFTPLGYRIGNSLFNVTAIFAVYLIGREYRNPRVGFWAAIVLAGNAPFIHFGRLMSNGSAATCALWAIAALALALKHKRTSLWLFMGLVAGAAFYQWPVARVGVTAGAVMYALVFLRLPLSQLRQLPHHVFGLAGVALLLAPLVCIWMAYPERFMARAHESLPGLKLGREGVGVDLSSSTIELFYRSLGWIFNEYDRSSQGSTSPGFNAVEAVLFACGLVILCIEGFSLNILLGLMLIVTLLVCGAWSVGPPWYTRVLPSAPIACVVIARALEGLHNLLSVGRRWLFWTTFAFISAGLLIVSPWSNFQKYYDYETAVVRRNNLHPMTAIGRTLHKVGPQYTYVFLLLGKPLWSFSDLPSFAQMFPYISNLKMRECYDVREELPVRAGESKGFLVQVERFDVDVPVIKQYHPNAEVTAVEDINGDRVAYLVLVDVK